MSDPLEQVQAFIARAQDERSALQRQAETARTEIHQLRRQLERARDANQRLEERYVALEQQLNVANERVERSERATRDHVARTG